MTVHSPTPPPHPVLPYMGYVGKCCCEGYGFRAVYSSIGFINQSIWVENRLSFFTKLRKLGLATQKYKKYQISKFKFLRLCLNSVDR